MLCQEPDCTSSAELICKLCSKYKIFCANHGIAHSKSLNHKIESISEEDAKKLMLNNIKRKIKDSIVQILKETEILTAQINKASTFAIRNLKELNKNITTISNFKVVPFKQRTIKYIREQTNNLINGIKALGAIYLAFTTLSLEDKKKYARSNWINFFEYFMYQKFVY